MPGFVLHVGANVSCLHGGRALPTAITSRVTVSGMAVTTLPAPYTIIGCSMPAPPGGNGPCVMANWVVAAGRVTSMGQPVLLMDSRAVCVPTGTPLIVTATQTRVAAT